MPVHEKIRDYIQLHGLRSDLIALTAHIPVDAFQAMLQGEKTLYADDLRAICIALNVSADTFIGTKTA